MEKFSFGIIMLLFILFFFIVSSSPLQLLSTLNTNTTNYNSLVAFKSQLMKQSINGASSTILNSWNDTTHFCSWEGVTCGHKHQNKVVALDLSSSGLVGPLPPSIANLTFLRRLDLSLNWLNGEIHPNLARLQRLQYLNLSFNSFHGDIPPILMENNSAFQVLDLCCNQLTGKIPATLNSMSQLNHLDLSNNSIIGTIPSSLGNLSSLETVRVFSNHIGGGIPLEIGSLRKLKHINVAGNNLSGSIPSAFFNLSSLRIILLVSNHFYGDISTNIAQAFPYLEIFYIGGNHFFGSLHQALQNVTSIRRLDIEDNNFTGVVPPDLGKMHNLIYLNMQYNKLEAADAKDWRFLDSLTNCTSLETLALCSNNLGGMLPKSIGNLSIELQKMILGFNYISGSIPFELGRYTKLNCLGMERNLLQGPIPESIGKLQRLQDLNLFNNSLTGSIPYSLGNLTKLINLFLGFNQLTGSIPSTLKNLNILSILNLRQNNLSGLIPRGIFLMHSILDTLDLSYNSFTGTLPLEVGHLEHLMFLDFSNNNLTGKIPESFGSCQLLLQLNIEYNFFHGSIPISIGNIKNLEILDLSHNNLSGVIPHSLQNIMFLKRLNLSFNNLEGEVPYKGVFANFSAIILIGNEKLCGGISKLHLPRCVVSSSSTKKRNHHLIKILAPILSILVLILALVMCYTLLYRNQKQSGQSRNSSTSSLNTQFPRISYTKLARATNDFSTSNLVGHGRYGFVYKGALRDYEDIVAVKVFNLEVHGVLKSFTSECNTLRRVRHRNIIRVLNSCSSIDHQGKDFKSLIYEFMPRGNLDKRLHQENETDEDNILYLEKRLNIIINVADALEYLHHNCEPSIVHCDIKPSNILLDKNMIAHVGDFGLSRMLSEAMSMPVQDYSDKSAIKGTIGYIAPEYGEGACPSTSADVYSFGIILLEMLTGRRPTDDIFHDNLNLYNHVKMAFPHGINNIIDLKMFTKEQRYTISNCQSINKCLLSLAEVALSCSASLLEERPSMRDVVTKLHAIRVSYLQSDGNEDFF
ncbi:hypothetical protein KFK09_027676 [Dendrobium nobile]|uniref:Receptor kinase-like protein Xa21 n=1 Tax=Dendrobium nobile TaxID=94219 RepID=A0A8T3A586_DENNO|nr:hypothetical protein KFK09_027676 [Dendrobium nobile]